MSVAARARARRAPNVQRPTSRAWALDALSHRIAIGHSSLSITLSHVRHAMEYASWRLYPAVNGDSRPGTDSQETWLWFPIPAP